MSLLSIAAVTLAILSTSFADNFLNSFIQPRAIGICSVIGLVCLVYPDFKNHTVIEKLYRTSMAAVLVFASYGVAIYLYGIASASA